MLRAVIGELAGETDAAPVGGFATDTVTQIETNIDDLSPEITGSLIDRLLAAGALDAFFIPAQMKKNRPGVLLTVLCETDALDALSRIIFEETSSFGLRLTEKRRLKLDRRTETVQTPHGVVEIKLGFDGQGKLLQAAPEFESCKTVAARSGQPVREIYLAAMQAFRQKPTS